MVLAGCAGADEQVDTAGAGTPGDGTAPPAVDGHPRVAVELVDDAQGGVALVNNPGTGTLFMATQEGKVVTVDPDAGVTGTALDLSDRVSDGFEQGLLGIGIAPGGGELYASYTAVDNTSHLVAFALDGDTVVAGSERSLLTLDQPKETHNGGSIVVTPDGVVWMALGDGAAENQVDAGTGELARDPFDLHGTIIRIDPTPGDDGSPYQIPPDNPFADGEVGAPEVWSWGLRNPWRFGIDLPTGTLWIGDVGNFLQEEINWVTAEEGAGAGADFGWNLLEGTLAGNRSEPGAGDVDATGTVLPLLTLDHADGYCSVTAGPIYRGTAISGLDGWMVFSDLCDSRLQGLRRSPGGGPEVIDLGAAVPGVVAIEQDADGNLWALSFTEGLHRVTPA